jgi:hypothetical protein
VERVWLYLRERCLSHRMLDDHEAVLEAVCRTWSRLLDETGCLFRGLSSVAFTSQLSLMLDFSPALKRL